MRLYSYVKLHLCFGPVWVHFAVMSLRLFEITLLPVQVVPAWYFLPWWLWSLLLIDFSNCFPIAPVLNSVSPFVLCQINLSFLQSCTSFVNYLWSLEQSWFWHFDSGFPVLYWDSLLLLRFSCFFQHSGCGFVLILWFDPLSNIEHVFVNNPESCAFKFFFPLLIRLTFNIF